MLSDLMVRQAKATGKPYTLADFDGLSLYVSANGAKAWHFRFSWGGKRDRMSFGSYPALRGAGYLRLQGHSPEVLQQLHREAAEWLLDNRRYAEAVQQSGRAREFNHLLPVVEQHSFDLLRQGRIGSIVDFPDDLPEQDSDHLTLAITEASTVIVTNDIARARNRLLRLLRNEMALQHPERPNQTVAFLHSRLVVLGGNFNHGLRLVTEALQQYPQRNAASAVLQSNQANCLFALGRSREAQHCAMEALEKLSVTSHTPLDVTARRPDEASISTRGAAAETTTRWSRCPIPPDKLSDLSR